MTLFPRLVVFVMRDNDIASSFSGHLPYPTLLSKIGIMRDQKNQSYENIHIIDGGELLCLVQWLSNTSYIGVINSTDNIY